MAFDNVCTILANLKFEQQLIYQLLREDIMQKSFIYQDILKGNEEGAARMIIVY